MSAKRCHRCDERAHIAIGRELVCWACYNRTVREADGKVEARTLRRSAND